ncbi:MAG: hypothetical protein AAF847_00265 [Bacteroidota bacterium]
MTNLVQTTTSPEEQIMQAYIENIVRFAEIERFKEVITEISFEFVTSKSFSNMHPVGEEYISYMMQLHRFFKQAQQVAVPE